MKILLLLLLVATAAACADSPTAPTNDQIPCAEGYHRALVNGQPVGECVPR